MLHQQNVNWLSHVWVWREESNIFVLTENTANTAALQFIYRTSKLGLQPDIHTLQFYIFYF
jgi:hypothetical protein